MSDSRYLGIAMCAPVSPPVVVVFERSRLGWSCHRVTAMTLPIVMMVIAPGTHHQAGRPERAKAGAGDPGPVAGVGAGHEGGSWTLTASMSGGSITVDRGPAGAAGPLPRTALVRPHPVYVTGRTLDGGLGQGPAQLAVNCPNTALTWATTATSGAAAAARVPSCSAPRRPAPAPRLSSCTTIPRRQVSTPATTG